MARAFTSVRGALVGASLTAAATALGLVAATGCFDKSICSYAVCAGGSGGGGGATTTSTSSTSTDSSTSTGTAECDPAALPVGAAINASCGLFVDGAAAPAGADGSQSKPFNTIADAIAHDASGKPIYVCNGTAPISEAVVLISAERLYGGMACGDWKLTAQKTAWTSPANTVPLTLEQTVNVYVRGFAITAPAADGTDPMTGQGASSIGVVINMGGGAIEDCDISAGDAAKGKDGDGDLGSAAGRDDFPTSFDGNTGGGCDAKGGPAKAYSQCTSGNPSQGAAGGDGGLNGGANGGNGLPGLPGGAPDGSGGIGDDGSTGWTCAADGGIGVNGHNGLAGSAGSPGLGDGTVDGGGYYGVAGGRGGPGGNAQGGGGGGGRGKDVDACANVGPSGGSGGAGGCGGAGGGGGGSGGASFAVLSLNALVTFQGVRLIAGKGGDGGHGGDGQFGGKGGFGGNGGGSACRGGAGGTGGTGGGGGGGRGGPSVALAYTGTAPDVDPTKLSAAAAPSLGGIGGVGGATGEPGDNGALAPMKAF